MSWTLGKAEKKDSDRINELFVEMLQTIYHTDQVNGYAEGDLDRFFDGRDEWVSIAIDEGQIIAFLSIEVHHEEEEYVYLDDLSVTEQYRNQGIGTTLIRNAEKYAKDIHIHEICFHVEKSNTEAFRLYQRLGYEIYEDQGSRYLMMKHIEEGQRMNAKLLGFFSGFPTRHFTDPIAEVLKEALDTRDSLVFISCQPDNYTQNDEDSHGMHRMFAERNMGFAKHTVIDHRTKADEAVNLVREASCIFLMGGNATLQFQLMRDKGILEEVRRSSAVILGVSAGAMNMGGPTVDIYETPTPYEGLGFANITVKAHYPLEDEWLQALKQVSMELPICLMTDESAIFVKEESITKIGEIYRLEKGEIRPLTQEQLEEIKK